MPSRKLSDLVLQMQIKANEFALSMHDAGIQFIFTQTKRTLAEQTAYYAQGRERVEEVNRLRAIAGLCSIGHQENKIITKTMRSKHLTGEAFDIAIIVKGKIVWDAMLDADGDGISEYKEAGLIGEGLGLKWGGRFGDCPHFELREDNHA